MSLFQMASSISRATRVRVPAITLESRSSIRLLVKETKSKISHTKFYCRESKFHGTDEHVNWKEWKPWRYNYSIARCHSCCRSSNVTTAVAGIPTVSEMFQGLKLYHSCCRNSNAITAFARSYCYFDSPSLTYVLMKIISSSMSEIVFHKKNRASAECSKSTHTVTISQIMIVHSLRSVASETKLNVYFIANRMCAKVWRHKINTWSTDWYVSVIPAYMCICGVGRLVIFCSSHSVASVICCRCKQHNSGLTLHFATQESLMSWSARIPI